MLREGRGGKNSQLWTSSINYHLMVCRLRIGISNIQFAGSAQYVCTVYNVNVACCSTSLVFIIQKNYSEFSFHLNRPDGSITRICNDEKSVKGKFSDYLTFLIFKGALSRDGYFYEGL